MLREIDAAHEMGIDVFVLDTGWYEKTGDWSVNPERFRDGMKRLKARLDAYGMRLGLWIGPTLAAGTSLALLGASGGHPDQPRKKLGCNLLQVGCDRPGWVQFGGS